MILRKQFVNMQEIHNCELLWLLLLHEHGQSMDFGDCQTQDLFPGMASNCWTQMAASFMHWQGTEVTLGSWSHRTHEVRGGRRRELSLQETKVEGT